MNSLANAEQGGSPARKDLVFGKFSVMQVLGAILVLTLFTAGSVISVILLSPSSSDKALDTRSSNSLSGNVAGSAAGEGIDFSNTLEIEQHVQLASLPEAEATQRVMDEKKVTEEEAKKILTVSKNVAKADELQKALKAQQEKLASSESSSEKPEEKQKMQEELEKKRKELEATIKAIPNAKVSSETVKELKLELPKETITETKTTTPVTTSQSSESSTGDNQIPQSDKPGDSVNLAEVEKTKGITATQNKEKTNETEKTTPTNETEKTTNELEKNERVNENAKSTTDAEKETSSNEGGKTEDLDGPKQGGEKKVEDQTEEPPKQSEEPVKKPEEQQLVGNPEKQPIKQTAAELLQQPAEVFIQQPAEQLVEQRSDEVEQPEPEEQPKPEDEQPELEDEQPEFEEQPKPEDKQLIEQPAAKSLEQEHFDEIDKLFADAKKQLDESARGLDQDEQLADVKVVKHPVAEPKKNGFLNLLDSVGSGFKSLFSSKKN